MSDEIRYPAGFSLKDIVDWGNSGLVCLDSQSQTVVKCAHAEENEAEIAVEKKIYERFRDNGGHPGILQYHGPYDIGIRLQFAPHGNLASFLESSEPNVEQRLRWCQQVASAVHFAHSNNVIHGDLRCGNILLDTQLNAKLADFGGSSLDGSPLLIAVTASHRSPGPALSVQGDLFALGSTMYHIITGATPFAPLDEEIEAFYAQSKFACTKQLGPIGHVITNCWQGQYHAANIIVADITGMHRSTNPH